jgi:hypothetical protein
MLKSSTTVQTFEKPATGEDHPFNDYFLVSGSVGDAARGYGVLPVDHQFIGRQWSRDHVGAIHVEARKQLEGDLLRSCAFWVFRLNKRVRARSRISEAVWAAGPGRIHDDS